MFELKNKSRVENLGHDGGYLKNKEVNVLLLFLFSIFKTDNMLIFNQSATSWPAVWPCLTSDGILRHYNNLPPLS